MPNKLEPILHLTADAHGVAHFSLVCPYGEEASGFALLKAALPGVEALQRTIEEGLTPHE